MIILIDNKNFMIRYCKDEPNIHGFDVTFPNWQGWMKLLSDIGDTVVVSGPEAEKYLDKHNIYYVHVERVAKESFFKFERRLKRLIEENKEFIETNTSFAKLAFAVTVDGNKGTINTNNEAAIWRYHEDSRYYVDFDVDMEEDKDTRIHKALMVEKELCKNADCSKLKELSDEVDEILYGPEVVTFDELFSADTYHEAVVKLLTLCEISAEDEY